MVQDHVRYNIMADIYLVIQYSGCHITDFRY